MLNKNDNLYFYRQLKKNYLSKNSANTKINMNSAVGGLAKHLIANGAINLHQARNILRLARHNHTSFATQLAASQLVDAQSIAAAASNQFQVPYLDLQAFDLQQLPRNLVDTSLIQQNRILPLRRNGNRLFVAVADPGQRESLKEIEFHTGLAVEPIVVEVDKLQTILSSAINGNARQGGSSLRARKSVNTKKVKRAEPVNLRQQTTGATDNNGTVQLVNRIVADAISLEASDIHIEPFEQSLRIRYRVDGKLRQVSTPKPEQAERIVARIKVLAQLDISERRVPQDGRISVRMTARRVVHVRVSTLPTSWGEKIVLRLLDADKTCLQIDHLGFEQEQRQLYLQALEQQQGMILISGPTGSGKSVTLYSGLQLLNAEERNISTVEDPVEVNLPGINQVAVNARVGLEFATALRAFLRQDPDVIMVGEIRDPETAEIAVRAAQTGHLVLSTLHTNSAAEIVTRLHSMGIPPYNLATSVKLVLAQRLARKLCSHCKEIARIPENVLEESGFNSINISKLKVFRAVGCNHCLDGYRGRVGIYEVVPITATMSQIIMVGGNSIQLGNEARKAGYPSLREAALFKVAQGLISLDEAYRLT